MDIVKNYKQYNYDDAIRNIAIEILNGRGISKEMLIKTGNFENQKYEEAKDVFKGFTSKSKLVLGLYIFLLVSNIISGIVPFLTYVIFLVSIVYIIKLIGLFKTQNKLYKVIGENFDSGVLIYFLLGIPFYVFLHFYYKKEIEQKISNIS